MILYKFGDIECKISFKDFLSLTTKYKKLYKKDFQDIYQLYEFIEFELKNIQHLLFDGYEYYLHKGLLHNLYGPAYLYHREDKDGYLPPGTTKKFYIDGKLVCHRISDYKCKNIDEFQSKQIHHYENLTNKKSGSDPITGRTYICKEGIDYLIHPIDLDARRKLDIRRRKLN